MKRIPRGAHAPLLSLCRLLGRWPWARRHPTLAVALVFAAPAVGAFAHWIIAWLGG